MAPSLQNGKKNLMSSRTMEMVSVIGGTADVFIFRFWNLIKTNVPT